jgi:hypothetical protein
MVRRYSLTAGYRPSASQSCSRSCTTQARLSLDISCPFEGLRSRPLSKDVDAEQTESAAANKRLYTVKGTRA